MKNNINQFKRTHNKHKHKQTLTKKKNENTKNSKIRNEINKG